MAGHTHDGIDWVAAVARLRASDDVHRDVRGELARRLVRPQTRVVLDVGCGAGGMGAAFADALAGTGGTVVLVDAVPELLAAAGERVRAAAGPLVEVRAVQADAGSDGLLDVVPRADLVFASAVVHHLPDQQRGITRLAGLLNPGGRLALVEGGLEQRCLPWDLGVGEPGLQERLATARAEWFCRMRAGMSGSVRLPVGWNLALADAGLVDVTSFSYLVDQPAPLRGPGRAAVLQQLSWLREVAGPWIGEADQRTIDLLLDPRGEHYLGHRDDIFLLAAATVYLGTAPPQPR